MNAFGISLAYKTVNPTYETHRSDFSDIYSFDK